MLWARRSAAPVLDGMACSQGGGGLQAPCGTRRRGRWRIAREVPMNHEKAVFFDAEAAAPWAVAPFGAEDQPKIARLLAAAAIRPGAWVLEPGCGTGRVTTILADAVGPDGRVIALDISQKMIEACRDRVGGRENVRVAQAAVEEYALAPETVDVIVCHQVLPHFDDKPAALAALVRVLKPLGRLLGAFPGSGGGQ